MGSLIHPHVPLTRRRFLAGAGNLALSVGLLRSGTALADVRPTDEEIVRRTLAWAATEGLSGRPIGKIMAAIGRTFLTTPYVARSLEEPGPEHLVVNLRGFDCLTFVENSLALARCVRLRRDGFSDFRAQLTSLRYRGGIIDGYPSRLHYFTDWLGDNHARGNVEDITERVGGVRYRKAINFMTEHRTMYPQLADTGFVRSIGEAERRLSSLEQISVPANAVAAVQPLLQDGDIIGTTTSMEGMDVSHTGMVVLEGTVCRFLHAPLSGGEVVLSPGSLADYVASIKKTTGIVVGRPREPKV
jgi:cell wall-associated NlpC family hydrolase